MPDFVYELKREFMQVILQMDRNHWLIVFGILVAIGFFCMRGFGSRTSY